jgi:hypothetical protein
MAEMLDHRTFDHEACGHVDGVGRAVPLFDRSAIGADEEFCTAIIMGVGTADESVERFDLVDQAGGHQEIQGTVDRRRLGSPRPGLERFEQVVGLHRGVGFQNQFEHTAAYGREFFTPLDAVSFGGLKGPGERIASHLTDI